MTARCGRSPLERDLAKLIESNSLVRACVDAGRKNRMSERQILLMMVGALAATIDAQREMMKPSYRPSAYSVHEWKGPRPESPASEVYDKPGIQLVTGTGTPTVEVDR